MGEQESEYGTNYKADEDSYHQTGGSPVTERFFDGNHGLLDSDFVILAVVDKGECLSV